VLQFVAVCCSVLQCVVLGGSSRVEVCCSVFQCVADCCLGRLLTC